MPACGHGYFEDDWYTTLDFADKVFKDADDTEFTGYVKDVTISIPPRK